MKYCNCLGIQTFHFSWKRCYRYYKESYRRSLYERKPWNRSRDLLLPIKVRELKSGIVGVHGSLIKIMLWNRLFYIEGSKTTHMTLNWYTDKYRSVIPIWFLHTYWGIKSPRMPVHHVTLKVGGLVMFLRNLN